MTDTSIVPPIQIVFLCGQSDPARCALSPVQQAFLDALPVPAAAKVPRNFPYAETGAWRPTSLLTGSVHNARHYLTSRRPEFAARHASVVRQQLARTPRTLILAGSNGLELLVNLQLPREVLDRVEVFAYGPVARRRPDCACVLVQGRSDWLSRAWFPRVDHRVNCGHFDYLKTPQVLSLCIATIQRLTAQETP